MYCDGKFCKRKNVLEVMRSFPASPQYNSCSPTSCRFNTQYLLLFKTDQNFHSFSLVSLFQFVATLCQPHLLASSSDLTPLSAAKVCKNNEVSTEIKG